MGGAQIFREDESSELYPKGLLIMIALVIAGLFLTALQVLIYLLQNRVIKKTRGQEELNIL